MSRARNIKPGFFKNEILVELPFEQRLLFIGLWTLADRAGRLEDRPVRIKMEIFPADNLDVNAGLQALHDNGFILRYEASGIKYIQVIAWDRHQNPHIKEATSTIPEPDTHGASTVQDTTKVVASPSDSLIPDSLIPDSQKLPSSSSAPRQPARDDDGPVPGEQDLPSWVPKPLWREFYRHRAVIRKPLSIPGQRQVVARLVELSEAGHDIASSLRQTMAAGLAIPVEPRNNATGPPNGKPALGKTAQAIQALEDMKHGNRLGIGRDFDGHAETAAALAGKHAGQ